MLVCRWRKCDASNCQLSEVRQRLLQLTQHRALHRGMRGRHTHSSSDGSNNGGGNKTKTRITDIHNSHSNNNGAASLADLLTNLTLQTRLSHS